MDEFEHMLENLMVNTSPDDGHYEDGDYQMGKHEAYKYALAKYRTLKREPLAALMERKGCFIRDFFGTIKGDWFMDMYTPTPYPNELVSFKGREIEELFDKARAFLMDLPDKEK